MNAEFSFVDLFAGIGGFRIALESVGGHCAGFSEIASDAIRTYSQNFHEDENGNLGDITKLKALPAHDFMTAGVPCQSWSIAGKNLGFDDDRGQLWNDALFLLKESKPKAFIFENVKGLSDPRNREALDYILKRIAEAGYHAKKFLINAYDYGSPQTRVRIYIVGFREEKFLRRFSLGEPCPGKIQLKDILDGFERSPSERIQKRNADFHRTKQSLSFGENGFNDYFLFNDIRGGDTTIHSWDIQKANERQRRICSLLLKNRRKPQYGPLDGNPLSLKHFQELDSSIELSEIGELVKMKIFKEVRYKYEVLDASKAESESEKSLLSFAESGFLIIDRIKNRREVKKLKINVPKELCWLEEKSAVRCVEVRYDFKNSKISSGIEGVNRIFLPSSKIYPTLVASDTNDYISPVEIQADSIPEFRKKFLDEVYRPKKYRKISKEETCRIQGFPDDFILPPSRPRWMKLLGNSVCIPVVKMLARQVVDTGVFAQNAPDSES